MTYIHLFLGTKRAIPLMSRNGNGNGNNGTERKGNKMRTALVLLGAAPAVFFLAYGLTFLAARIS
jgi:hypothetical protein